MAEIFGNQDKIRGCFSVFRFNAGGSRGAQLIMPQFGDLPSMSYSDPLLCIGFEARLSETVLFNKCFGNRVYTYAFGHDPNNSSLSVNLLGFLIDKQDYSKVVDNVMKSYMDNRVSASKKVATLVLGNSRPLQGFVTGISSNTVDPQHSLQAFTVHLAIPGL